MRKIIRHKLYDTEKAELLYEISYYNKGHFDYLHECLYRTPKGNFFLYGEGGANTKYAESTEDGWFRKGSDIIPLTSEEALEWLEKNNVIDIILVFFPGTITDA